MHLAKEASSMVRREELRAVKRRSGVAVGSRSSDKLNPEGVKVWGERVRARTTAGNDVYAKKAKTLELAGRVSPQHQSAARKGAVTYARRDIQKIKPKLPGDVTPSGSQVPAKVPSPQAKPQGLAAKAVDYAGKNKLKTGLAVAGTAAAAYGLNRLRKRNQQQQVQK